jgi:alpha-galactosidase
MTKANGKLAPWIAIGSSILLVVFSSRGLAKDDGLARTPPMGWNSWNAFKMDIDESKIKAIADAMVSSGMREAGYVYLVLDDGWMAKARDGDGNLTGDPLKFPGGMKALGDYIHGKGLKYGLYECRGYLTCQKLPGSLGHEERDMSTFASWGVDYIKLDSCFAERNGRLSSVELAVYRSAIERTGRPMVLSLSDFGNGSWAWGAGASVHLWRTSYDISRNIGSVYACAETSGGDGVIHPAFNGLWQFAGPGRWNDADMLQVGNLPGPKEDKVHFSLWSILASPLMAGNDLRSMPESVRAILTAPEVIAVNQDPRGFQGYRVYRNGGREIYNRPLSDGTTAVLLLNKNEAPADLTVTWDEIGLRGAQKVRDLWERKDLGEFKNSFTAANLSRHEHLFLKVGTPGGKPLPGPAPVPLEKYSVSRSGTTYLGDLYYVMKQGDAPRTDTNSAGGALSIKGTKYPKGLGCRTSSRIMYKLGGKADRFRAVAGLDDSYAGPETARFRVLNEDFFGNQVLFDSGKLTRDQAAVKIDIDVKGVEYLLLMIDGKGVAGDWADAKVIAGGRRDP